jgi:radical SAM superfamily enzyme YgiQ (UPF0313 family)
MEFVQEGEFSMWIKLISPGVGRRSVDSKITNQIMPPLPLLALAALTPEQHRLTLEDENIERIHLDDRPDLVGITVKAQTAVRAYQLARYYRQKGVPVILGGIHPTACPEEALAHADAVVIGEAEEIWGKVLADVAQGKLERTYRQANPANLAGAPIPRYDLIRSKPYIFPNTVAAGRGCPWHCEFCYNSSPNVPQGHRMKPVANILAEIEAVGTRHIMFVDDNFIGNPAQARELLEALTPLGLTWMACATADIGHHDELLDLMAASGCQSLFIGFETLNADSLFTMQKVPNRVEEYNATIEKIHRRGMMVNASLVFGFDGDGPEVFGDTLKWLIAQKVETVTAHVLTPFPGTAFYQRMLKEGRIFDFDLSHYDTSRVVFRPLRMTPQELEEGFQGFFNEFYSWRSVWARLPWGSSQLTAYLLFNLAYRRFGPILSLLGRFGLMNLFGRLGRGLSYPQILRSRRTACKMLKSDLPLT